MKFTEYRVAPKVSRYQELSLGLNRIKHRQ